MNFESIKGEWNELKGKFRAKWGKLTDEDTELFKSGDHQSFKDRLRERYGYSKERAEQEYDEFKTSLSEKKDDIADKIEEKKEEREINRARDAFDDAHGGDRLN